MVQAYRDTWELGVHSFLTYLRDRLLLARELLHPSGSIFVQMSDTNLHHVREVMDEVFGAECFVSQISFQTTSGFQTRTLATLGDFLLWYARDPGAAQGAEAVRGTAGDARRGQRALGPAAGRELPGCDCRRGNARRHSCLKARDSTNPTICRARERPVDRSRSSSRARSTVRAPTRTGRPTTRKGLSDSPAADRIHVAANSIQYRRFASDFPYKERGNLWTDTLTGSFTDEKMYVVQTNPKVVERCLLMTSDPGDLVLDPTCGSGTTAWCARSGGGGGSPAIPRGYPSRSRGSGCSPPRSTIIGSPNRSAVRQAASSTGANGTGKARRSGGIVPHVTLESIANDEPPKEEVLVDRPETDGKVTRVSGPFCVEATIPTPVDWEGDGKEDSGDAAAIDAYADHVERMIEVLRRSPVLHLGGGQRVTLSRSAPARAHHEPVRRSADRRRGGADGRHRLRPGERRSLGSIGVRGGARGLRQGLRPALRDRLRRPARCAAP